MQVFEINLCDDSCTKICLVNVYDRGQQERTLKVYTILTNRASDHLKLFNLFNLKGDAYSSILGTYSGITEEEEP